MAELSLLGRIGSFLASAWTLGPDMAARADILWRQTKNARVRLGLARYRPAESYTLRTRFGELHLRDNFGDVTNLPDVLHRRVYDTGREPGPGVVLDVGANVGIAAVWFRATAPGRPIHCFEALAENAAMARLNCPEAVVNIVAVGQAAGSVTLGVDPDAVMATKIPWDRATGTRELAVIALDDYVQTREIDRVALLKIDVEGMEVEVLRGAAFTLQITEQVVMETHGHELHRAAMDVLTRSGFAIERDEFFGHTGLVAGLRVQ